MHKIALNTMLIFTYFREYLFVLLLIGGNFKKFMKKIELKYKVI